MLVYRIKVFVMENYKHIKNRMDGSTHGVDYPHLSGWELRDTITRLIKEQLESLNIPNHLIPTYSDYFRYLNGSPCVDEWESGKLILCESPCGTRLVFDGDEDLSIIYPDGEGMAFIDQEELKWLFEKENDPQFANELYLGVAHAVDA